MAGVERAKSKESRGLVYHDGLSEESGFKSDMVVSVESCGVTLFEYVGAKRQTFRHEEAQAVERSYGQ
jgi:hypothetical protein